MNAFVNPEPSAAAAVTLTVRLTGAEGAFLRAASLIERRGWVLEAISLGPDEGEGKAFAALVAPRQGDREAEVLKRQLERLHDVLGVDLSGASAEGTAP